MRLFPRDPAEAEALDLLHNIEFSVQTIEQLLNQLEERLAPAVVSQVRELDNTLGCLDADRSNLIDELGTAQLQHNHFKRVYKRLSTESLPWQEQSMSEGREKHKEIFDRLNQTLSELSLQLKRYEDKYGPLIGYA